MLPLRITNKKYQTDLSVWYFILYISLYIAYLEAEERPYASK